MTVIDRISSRSLGNLYFMPPVLDGLVGLFQPRRSIAESLINRAPGATVHGSITGTPTFTANGAILGPDAYIDTGLPETREYTLISIARKNPNGGVMLIGSLAGSINTTPYALLAQRLNTPPRFINGAKTTPVSTQQNIAYNLVDDNYEFAAAACDGSNFTLTLPRNPISSSGNNNPRTDALAGPRDAPTNNWRIGAALITTATYPNSTEHNLAIIYSRALSELEIRTIYADAIEQFQPRGITIQY